MRSRYTAYTQGLIDYIEATQSGIESFDRAAAQRWADESEWIGLEIRATRRGRRGQPDGTVEFVARYRDAQGEQALDEVSRFRRVQGRWLYVGGVAGRPEPSRTVVRVGRNAPCPCGSGRKHKRCCGG